MSRLQEAVTYFRERNVLCRLALAFCEKYRSLGHWGGIAVLGNLTEQERQDLSAFLRRQVSESIRISYREFSGAWQKTRFSEMGLQELMENLYPEVLETKRRKRDREWQKRQRTILALMQSAESETARQWLDALLYEKLRLLHSEQYEDRELLQKISGALSELPKGYERLPFFANRVFGNPHALDFGTVESGILLQALGFLAGKSPAHTVEEKTALLYEFRLLRDDILNFATVYGLQAFSGEFELEYWRMAAEAGAPLNMPLREIVRADRILTIGTEMKEKHAYIVENSGVFSELLEGMRAHRAFAPLIALHGQLKAASLALLDRLAASGTVFYYSGDLDPEGLLIAEHLLERYDNAHVWRFPVPDEMRPATETLSAARQKKLQRIRQPELLSYVEILQSRSVPYYQESITDQLLQDLLDCGREKW